MESKFKFNPYNSLNSEINELGFSSEDLSIKCRLFEVA